MLNIFNGPDCISGKENSAEVASEAEKHWGKSSCWMQRICVACVLAGG